MNFSIYFVNFCQPIKYVFVRLWLVCFDSTEHHEPQDYEHSIIDLFLGCKRSLEILHYASTPSWVTKENC